MPASPPLAPLVVALLALAAPGAAAEDADRRAVGLSQAVALAARRNPTLGMSVADEASARAAVTTAAGLDDPFVDAAATWSQTSEPSTSAIAPGTNADLQLSLGVTQPLPTGGKVALGLVDEYLHADAAPASGAAAVSQWRPVLQLRFAHPLLRGAGVAVARAAQRKARIGVSQAAGARAAVAAGLVRDVVRAYWELYFAERQLAVLRGSAAGAREQLAIVQANIAVGKQPPSASAEVEVAIANRESDALSAEDELVARAVELARLTGAEVDGGAADLRAADRPGGETRLPTLAEVLGAALTGNYDLLAARAGLAASAVDVDVARNARLPQLDVAANGGPLGAQPQASGAFGQLGRFAGYTVGASLVFQEPIPNRAARGTFAAARAGAAKAAANETAVRQQVEADAVRLVASAERAARRLAVLTPSLPSAERDLEAERARFAAGRSSNFDVLRRQDEVAQVELRQLRARVDFEAARAGIDALTGAILDRMQVTVR